jgi:DNA-binding NtrC family response regulator
LSTIRLDLMPLRERPEDIPVIARHFVERYNSRFGSTLSLGQQALARLERYEWPGNVRELLHAIEQALVVADAPVVEVRHLPSHASMASAPMPESDEPLASLQDVEKAHIERVVRACGGHRGRTAKTLGVSERNLYRLLRQYGLG